MFTSSTMFLSVVFSFLFPLVTALVPAAAHAAASGDFAGLIDIGGGRKMYQECRGTGSPTVVLVGGLRASAEDWGIAAEFHLRDMQAAARESGQQINVLKASSEREIDSAFKTLAERGGPLIVSTDPLFVSRYNQIVVLAAFHKIPAIYDRREFVVAGGLISAGTK
jgi:ABC transporter substrate binding protein